MGEVPAHRSNIWKLPGLWFLLWGKVRTQLPRGPFLFHPMQSTESWAARLERGKRLREWPIGHSEGIEGTWILLTATNSIKNPSHEIQGTPICGTPKGPWTPWVLIEEMRLTFYLIFVCTVGRNRYLSSNYITAWCSPVAIIFSKRSSEIISSEISNLPLWTHWAQMQVNTCHRWNIYEVLWESKYV